MLRFFIGLFFLLILFQTGCKEESSTVGLGILPEGDLFEVGFDYEQSSISAFTFSDEKQRSDETEYMLLGTFNDSIFGKTTADFAGQFRIDRFPDFKEKNAVADSLVLYLYYKEIYGDTVTHQKFKVYELASDLVVDDPYYQDVNLKSMAKTEILGEKDYVPKFRHVMKSDTIVTTDTVAQIIRIKLSASLIDKLWNAPTEVVSDQDLFLKYFKGLYIETQDQSVGGTIMNIYTLANVSRMVMHYHNQEEDSLYYNYNLNDKSARVNRIIHDYSHTSFAANLDQSARQDSLIYIQTLGGLNNKFFIPNIDTWKDSTDFVINKAELVFQVDTLLSFPKYNLPPSQLVLAYIDSEGKENLPSDFFYSSVYFGGYYSSTDGTYRFNIAKHIQDIIHQKTGKENHGFILTTSFESTSTSFRNSLYRRAVLKGATSKKGIRLEIIYSKIK
jgi:hypothetical protein